MMLLPDDDILAARGWFSLDASRKNTSGKLQVPGSSTHVIAEKIAMPPVVDLVPRPRLYTLVGRSLYRFGTTLITGRSGTGKSSLAAQYVKEKSWVAWYSIGSPDTDWQVFSRYFMESLLRGVTGTSPSLHPIPNHAGPDRAGETDVSIEAIEEFLSRAFSVFFAHKDLHPLVIVLDDLHHIFDSPWFGKFFNLLISSLPPDIHLILLCRGEPPAPLWRLRSKQLLGVIDEKLLAFTTDETRNFFKQAGLPESSAAQAHDLSFGRIAKLRQFAGGRAET